LTGDSYYVQLNGVQIASLKEGSYEDIMVWVLFIGGLIIFAGGMALPAGLTVLFLWLFFKLYELPYTLMTYV